MQEDSQVVFESYVPGQQNQNPAKPAVYDRGRGPQLPGMRLVSTASQLSSHNSKKVNNQLPKTFGMLVGMPGYHSEYLGQVTMPDHAIQNAQQQPNIGHINDLILNSTQPLERPYENQNEGAKNIVQPTAIQQINNRPLVIDSTGGEALLPYPGQDKFNIAPQIYQPLQELNQQNLIQSQELINQTNPYPQAAYQKPTKQAPLHKRIDKEDYAKDVNKFYLAQPDLVLQGKEDPKGNKLSKLAENLEVK